MVFRRLLVSSPARPGGSCMRPSSSAVGAGGALIRARCLPLRLALLLLLFPHPFQIFSRLLLVMLLRLHLRGIRRHPCPCRCRHQHAGEKNQYRSTHSLHNSSTATSYRSLGEAPLRGYAPLRGFPCITTLCFLASSRAHCRILQPTKVVSTGSPRPVCK